MDIKFKLSRDFEESLEYLKKKYGSEFEYINGLHENQLDFSEFINNFVDSENTANATIDSNANIQSKDIGISFTK